MAENHFQKALRLHLLFKHVLIIYMDEFVFIQGLSKNEQSESFVYNWDYLRLCAIGKGGYWVGIHSSVTNV